MSMNNTAALAARFSSSAPTYDRSARVQRAVAGRVADMVAGLPEPRLALEIGCGTGLLTETLLEALPNATIHALDISRGMIEQAQARMGRVDRVAWFVADARRFEGGSEYDLIASSSCLHWILPVEEAFLALSRRLIAGGHLVFGMMLAGTLKELHASRRRVVPDKLPGAILPAAEEVLTALRHTGFLVLQHEQTVLQAEYPSAEEFLRAVHDQGTSGGDLSRGGRSLNRGELKRLAADYAAHYPSADNGVTATYAVLYAIARKRRQP